MKSMIFVAALAATSLAGPAFAQTTNDSAKPAKSISKAQMMQAVDGRFDALDTNKDGSLSVDELAAEHGWHQHRRGAGNWHHDGNGPDKDQMAKWMKQADTNGDGKISDAERQAAMAKFAKDHPQIASRWQNRMQADSDGSASTANGSAGSDANDAGSKMRQRMMARLDTNGDGTVSDAEKAAGRQKMEDRRNHMAQAMLTKLDTNHDGKVEKSEYEAAAAERFDKLDINGDGMIDQAERQASRADRKGKWSHKGNSTDDSDTNTSTDSDSDGDNS